MKKQAKIALGVVAGAIVLAAVGIGFSRKMKGDDPENVIYADSVGMLTGTGLGTQNRYAGVVESQDVLKISKNSDYTVKEIYVEAGQTIEVGTLLFSYDTDELDLKVLEAELKLESIGNAIETHKDNIADLTKEKKNASNEQQRLEFTIQIQQEELAQKQEEYNYKVQEMEVERLKKSTENSDVVSTIAGVVQEINKDGGYDYNTGEEKPFMSIRASGKFRIKGTISEQNMSEIYEGMPMAVHSRVSEEDVWYGMIESIDTSQTVGNGNGYMYESEGERASRYPFYIALDSSDGLMLGQHVYAEADLGTETREGMWLMSDYLVLDGDNAYVWAVDGKDRLEKRKVELGEFDEEMYQYQILSGLSAEDYIAWPSEECKEGAAAARNDGSTYFDMGMMEGGFMEEAEMEGEE